MAFRIGASETFLIDAMEIKYNVDINFTRKDRYYNYNSRKGFIKYIPLDI